MFAVKLVSVLVFYL